MMMLLFVILHANIISVMMLSLTIIPAYSSALHIVYFDPSNEPP